MDCMSGQKKCREVTISGGVLCCVMYCIVLCTLCYMYMHGK